MRFAAIPLRNLRQRPMRSALTAIGVAGAVAGFSVLTGLGRGVEEAWNRSASGNGTHLLAYRRGVLDVLAGTLDARIAAAVRAATGVGSVSAELVDVLTLDGGGTVLARGWEPGSTMWNSTELIAGRLPSEGSMNEAIIGEALAATLGVGPGGELRPFGAVLRVAGVARMEGALSNNSVVLPLAALQRLLDREGKITVLGVRVARGDDANEREAARARLGELFPQLIFVEAQSAAQHNEVYRFWRGMAWAASLVGLAMGFVIVVNTLLVAVLERTREIGVLVALGWSRRRILALVLLESLFLCLAGGVLGSALGWLGLEALVSHPKLRGFVVVAPSAAVFAQQLVITVLLGISAGLYPAWRAVQLNPVDALRDQ